MWTLVAIIISQAPSSYMSYKYLNDALLHSSGQNRIDQPNNSFDGMDYVPNIEPVKLQ